MMATKQAMVAGDHVQDWMRLFSIWTSAPTARISTSIMNGPEARSNIHYIKSIPSRIIQMPGSKTFAFRFLDENSQLQEQDFDLVVLVGRHGTACLHGEELPRDSA